MPWQEVSTMSLRQEFVALAMQQGVNVRELCRRFGVSPKTGYKWLSRFAARGTAGLCDESRRPHRSPTHTAQAVEQVIVELRDRHPSWGARKLCRRLHDVGWRQVPAPSTVQAILVRHGRIEPAESAKHTAWQRFEHALPNALWQMDFKGHFAIAAGRCHPLTVLDDHSRYNLCLQACADEQGHTVQSHLTHSFRRYGLPLRLLIDNGPPWGDSSDNPYTPLGAWLIRLGIRLCHSRPYHPQTLGKDERFHRTLKAEVLREAFADLPSVQRRFDRWRMIYNFERPHEALGMQTPARRYTPSARSFPETLPPIEYAPGDIVRQVQRPGYLCYRSRRFRMSKAFLGYPVALRPTTVDGVLEVFFCHQKIAQIDLTIV